LAVHIDEAGCGVDVTYGVAVETAEVCELVKEFTSGSVRVAGGLLQVATQYASPASIL
jgi:hypothetical protein